MSPRPAWWLLLLAIVLPASAPAESVPDSVRVRRLAALDPTDLGGRQTDELAQSALREPEGEPGVPELLANRREGALGEPARSIDPPLPGCHRGCQGAIHSG